MDLLNLVGIFQDSLLNFVEIFGAVQSEFGHFCDHLGSLDSFNMNLWILWRLTADKSRSRTWWDVGMLRCSFNDGDQVDLLRTWGLGAPSVMVERQLLIIYFIGDMVVW